jgi:hypothetical protein
MNEKKRKYLLYKIKGHLIKVDPDIFYEIVNVNPEFPKKKFNKFETVKIDEKSKYVRVRTRGKDKKDFLLARYILKAEKGQLVDHQNRNRLDYRRENLRIVTARQNSLNSTEPNVTGFIGVSHRTLNSRRKKPLFYYQASYKMGKKGLFFYVRRNLSDEFSSLYLAAIARDKFVLQAGEEAYAPLNFPKLKEEPFRSNLLKTDLRELRKKSYEEIKAKIFEEKEKELISRPMVGDEH